MIPRWAGLALAVVVTIATLAAGIARLQSPYRTPFSGSVHDAGTGGGKAVWRWAGRMGWPVVLVPATLPAVPALPHDTGNCLFSAGNDRLPAPEGTDRTAEWRALRAWVERGNSVFLVTAQPASLPAELFRHVLAAPPPAAVPPAAPARDPHATVASTGEVAVAAAGRLTVNAQGPRWRGVPDGWESAGDHRGTVYHRIPVGRGAVVVLLDDLAMTNAGLDLGANPDTIAALLAREIVGGAVAVAEARHGLGDSRSYLDALLALPGARSLASMGALLVALLLYGRSIRFGPPAPWAPRERRSAGEYVDALASLHERARAAPLMVEAVAHRLQAVARRRARGSVAVEGALERAARYRASASRERVPVEALRLMRELVRLRRDLLGSQRAQP